MPCTPVPYQDPVFKAILYDTSEPEIMKNTYNYLRFAVYHFPDVLCALYEDKGCYCVTWNKKGLRILAIAVRKGYEGQRIGSRMFAEIKSLAQRKGLSKITLRTHPRTKAYMVYIKWGFKTVKQMKDEVEMEYIFQ